MSRSKKRSVVIIFIAWFAYLISYLGRNDYSACVLEIVRSTGMTRASAGMISSSFALCNAVGQLISTILINKIPAIRMITAEIFSVAMVNLLFPVSSNFYVMMILWGINGCMQATLLCGITRIFSETLEEPWLSRGAVALNTIGCVGGVVNYLLTPVLIYFFHWEAVFFTVSTMLFALGVVWCIMMPRLTTTQSNGTNRSQAPAREKSKSIWKIICSGGIPCAIIAVFIIGALRESVSLWIPSYLNEDFKLTVSASTAITAVVPMLQICGALLAGKIGRKTNNLFIPTLIAFLCSTACFLTIPLIGTTTVMATIFLFTLNAISMTAALTFLLSLYPIRCMERKDIAKLVGLLNFFVHLGDFAASTGFGWLSSARGWTLTFFVMGTLSFLATIIVLIGMRISKKRKEYYVKERI